MLKLRPVLQAAPIRAFLLARGSELKTSEWPAGFDVEFYRSEYRDLPSSWTDEALARHFVQHGEAEGRFGNDEVKIAHLEQTLGPLPRDFQPATYLALNPDLAGSCPTRASAAWHFLTYGKNENRRYLDLDLYRSLNGLDGALNDHDVLSHYRSHIDDPTVARTGADFMAARRLTGGGAWIEKINLGEFKALNWEWAGQVRSKVEAGDLVLREGLSRLAPLSFSLRFDPTYYVEANPALSGRAPIELYRDWLFRGLESNSPGCASEALGVLGLDLDRYPEAFDWRVYARQAALGRLRSRWSALAHFMTAGGERTPPLRADCDPAPFLSEAARALAGRNSLRAISLFALARRFAPLSQRAMVACAQALFENGRWSEAADCCNTVLESGGSDLEIYLISVRSHIRQRDFMQAQEVLHRAAKDFLGSPKYRELASEVIEAQFHDAIAKAQRLYSVGERSEADTVLENAVRAAAQSWPRIDPLGAPADLSTKKRVVMLANTDIKQCTHYRVEQKIEIFREAKIDLTVFETSRVSEFMDSLPGAAAAIFYRTPAFPTTSRAIDYAQRLGIPTYFELDDLIFDNDYPEPKSTYDSSLTMSEYNGLLLGVPLFREAARLCDYGLTTTTALARRLQKHVKSGTVHLLPNGLDSRTFTSRARVDDHSKVVIFYGSGTKAHNQDFLDLAGHALAAVMKRNPHVQLVIAGYLDISPVFAGLRDRIVTTGFVANTEAYWSLLSEADINIAVLRPTAVTDAKSEIKWLEAAALGVPSVVSDTATYCEVLSDGVDALIARDAQEWEDKLGELILDGELRLRLGSAAREKAAEAYGIKANAERVGRIFGSADPRPRPSRDRKTLRRRVLLSNTFFPPQTIGGATRVVRDNLQFFGSSPLTRNLEFAAVASDAAGPIANRLRVEHHDGTTVFRISTPFERNMDWRPFNPEAGEQFARVLNLWRPDLVHFHATQRLTASALESCQKVGIPYIVTLHDAWWISDNQFLVDEAGSIVDPSDPLAARPPAGVDLGQSVLRRRRLVRLLEGAAAVLSVSKPFADIYEGCGVRSVVTENGISDFQRLPKLPSQSGKVRLTHVGGRSNHKGYHLVEAALRRGAFENLELTVVDHRYSGAVFREEVWGRSPVSFVGMQPQEAMGAFYSGQDVLLAPSIWPESFGLVTREAAAAGLWVLTGNRGAIGGDVVDGVNGWVVDVASPQGVYSALAQINAEPQRYRISPAPCSIRRSDAQAEELAAIYANVLSNPRR